MLKKFSYITDQLKIPETHVEMFENSFNYPHLSDILGRDQGKRRSWESQLSQEPRTQQPLVLDAFFTIACPILLSSAA